VMGGVCGMHTEEKKLEQCFCRKIWSKEVTRNT
jgi:hypothetical protein